MADGNKAEVPNLNASSELILRRFMYSSFAGGYAGYLFFRSPLKRWASLAVGAGLGIGSSYALRRISEKPVPGIHSDSEVAKE